MNWFSKMVHQMYGRRRDNRGLTLVELICAIAIFSVVATAAGSVLVVSARNYQRGAVEAELQQVAQLAVNQIEDLIIDANAAPGSGAHNLRIEKDGILYEVYLESAERQLQYREYTVGPDGVTPSSESQLLADNVDVFNVDMSQFAKNGNVLLHLELSNQDRTYAADFTITSRNGRYAGSTSSFGASIDVVKELVLEPGESYEFPLSVAGNLLNDAVDWTVSQNTSGSTKVEATDAGKYKISVGLDETAETVMFTVSTQELNGAIPYAFQTVKVHVRRVNSVNISAEKNNTNYTLTASVGGTNLASMAGVPTDDLLTNYVDPYKVKWEYFITDFSGAFTGENVSNYISNIVENGLTTSFNITGEFDEFNLLVRATALHPDGANKTHLDYGDVYGEWTLYKVIMGSEWARNGNSPMLVPSIKEHLIYDENGNAYLENYGAMTLNWWRDGGFGIWEYLGEQGNQGGFGNMQETNLGLKVWFKEGDPEYLYASLDHNNRNFSYSTPYFTGDFVTNYGVRRLKLELNIGGLETAIGVFNIKDVAFRYRNSTSEEWSDAVGGRQIIYVTPEDTTDTYTTYFMLIDGWEVTNTDYEVFNRFVGVIEDAPGYDNDKGYDLTFVKNDGSTYCNYVGSDTRNKWGLNYQIVNDVTDNGTTLSVKISAEEKQDFCNREGGLVIREIYEYNPWFTNTDPQNGIWAPPLAREYDADAPIHRNPNLDLSGNGDKAERIDGCDGILEYHFVQANVKISGSSNLPAVRYCPSLSELNGRNAYYISENSRYLVTGNTTAEYQYKDASGWHTAYNLTKGNDGIWRN